MRATNRKRVSTTITSRASSENTYSNPKIVVVVAHFDVTRLVKVIGRASNTGGGGTPAERTLGSSAGVIGTLEREKRKMRHFQILI